MVEHVSKVGGYLQSSMVVLLGDFNARVGKSSQVDDVIGMFGESWLFVMVGS